jgi:hypothetical protein
MDCPSKGRNPCLIGKVLAMLIHNKRQNYSCSRDSALFYERQNLIAFPPSPASTNLRLDLRDYSRHLHSWPSPTVPDVPWVSFATLPYSTI